MVIIPNETKLLLSKKHSSLQILLVILTLLIVVVFLSSCTNEQETRPTSTSLEDTQPYATYSFSNSKHVIDFGDQPYWVPAAIITEFMIRDPILKEELDKLGFIIRNHHFLKGADLNYFLARGDLEVGVAGDMPSLTIASFEDVSLLSIFKGPVSIVSKNIREIEHLKGKKIGYAYGSNAHFFLLDTLYKNKIDIEDVKLVEMDIVKMAGALRRGEIDAYSTWEFSPSTTMKIIQDKLTTRKGLSFGFLYMRDSFLKKNPEVANIILASQIRAIKWLKADANNIKLLSYWLYNELNEWGQKETPLSLNRILRHVNEATTYIQFGGYPRISHELLTDNGLLSQQLEFLVEHEYLPAGVQFAEVKRKIKHNLLEQILQDPRHYRIYEDIDLVKVK